MADDSGSDAEVSRQPGRRRSAARTSDRAMDARSNVLAT
jgi:hypothetical protein